jgi:hypothetical protein
MTNRIETLHLEEVINSDHQSLICKRTNTLRANG